MAGMPSVYIPVIYGVVTVALEQHMAEEKSQLSSTGF